VVVAGQGSLKDGSKIKVLEIDEAQQAANAEGLTGLASQG